MNNSSQKLSVVEKVGYSLGDLSANLVFQTLVTYLAYFYTDIYGLKPEDASVITLVVGLIAGFGFNPIVGALADRTRTKWGKFRPWILFSAVPLGVAAIFAFNTPNFSYHGKIVYAAITYSFLLLLYAANNLPYSALSGVITGEMGERNSISSYRFVAVMCAQFFVQVFMLPIILSVGHGDKAAGIETVMIWLAVIGSVMLLITFFTTKERVVPKPEQESTLKADLKDLSKNKPWIIMLVVTTLIFITLAIKGGSYVYYFNNYVDEPSLAKFISPITNFFNSIGMNFFGEDPKSAGFGLFNAGGIIMMIIGIMFSKKFADKYGKRDTFIVSLFISTLFVLIFIFFPSRSVGLMFSSQICHGFFYGISTPILWAMIADVADYSEWKNNRRATAIIFSAMMVGLKVGLSVGSSLVSMIIGKYGYISSGGSVNIIQSETVAHGAKLLVSIFPAIPFFAACGLLLFYEINKKTEIMLETELINRRIEKNNENA